MFDTTTLDTDLDGIEQATGCLNEFDLDSDDDGLADGVDDANRDGIVDAGETDPCNADSGGDGIDDGDEDLNCNGRVDAGETGPTDALSGPAPTQVPVPLAALALLALLLAGGARRLAAVRCRRRQRPRMDV